MARHPHISSNLLSNFARLSTFQTCQGMLRAATSARASGPRLHQEREAKLFVSFPFLLIERSFMDDFGIETFGARDIPSGLSWRPVATTCHAKLARLIPTPLSRIAPAKAGAAPARRSQRQRQPTPP